MKNVFLSILIGFFAVANAQKAPADIKSEFNEESLSQTVQDLNSTTFTVGEVFEKHRGEIILLDIWASWCRDCITGLPELKKLQNDYPELVYLFFSLDKIGQENAWKNAIEKFEIKGEHYWFNSDWKNVFTNYIELNWIPRYILIDKEGRIAHYYAIQANDSELLISLKSLISN